MNRFTQKEKISKSALDHSYTGKFSKNSKTGQMKMQSGGHGKENFAKLKEFGINYQVTKKYPNGVMVGNVENHADRDKNQNSGQSWFPQSWSRRKVKNGAERLANSIPYKLPNGKIMYGKYGKVKIGVIRTKGQIATIFPLAKQSGGKKNDKRRNR